MEDYIIYMDMIYKGPPSEKDKISFMMIDEVGLGKINFAFYENFLIQFYRMYGELLQANTIEDDKCHEIAKEVFQMMATVNLSKAEFLEGKVSLGSSQGGSLGSSILTRTKMLKKQST